MATAITCHRRPQSTDHMQTAFHKLCIVGDPATRLLKDGRRSFHRLHSTPVRHCLLHSTR